MWSWFFGLGMLIGGPVLLVNGARTITLARGAADWPTTPALILSSRVVEHKGRGTNYSPEVSYSYSVNGVEHRGSRITFMDYGADREWAASVSAQFPEASSAPVHYDPAAPEQAVLQIDDHWYMWASVGMGLTALFLGLLVCPATNLWGVIHKRLAR